MGKPELGQESAELTSAADSLILHIYVENTLCAVYVAENPKSENSNGSKVQNSGFLLKD